jgi:hypothetical protein
MRLPDNFRYTLGELSELLHRRSSRPGVEGLAKAQNASQEPQYFKGRDAEDFVFGALTHRQTAVVAQFDMHRWMRRPTVRR